MITLFLQEKPAAGAAAAPNILEFLDIGQYSNYKDTGLSIDQPLFEATPGAVKFQNCAPLQTYELPLVLRNIDRVARKVTVAQSTSPYFKVIPPKEQSGKVAAGMRVTYLVRFTPDQAKDYSDELIVTTERERFAVRVFAQGPRAALDLPDLVRFPPSAVKVAVDKILLLRNVGQAGALYSAWTEGPFSVAPAQGDIPVHGSAQLQLQFCSQRAGPQSGRACFQYVLLATHQFYPLLLISRR
jgi:hydrocephalus-inducing protein